MAPKSTRTTKPRAPRAPKATPMPSRPQKPVVGIWTWLTLLLFAGSVAFAVWLNKRPETPAADATEAPTVSFVFTDEDGLPTSIEVKPAEGDAVRVARNEEDVWALELPEEAEADQASAQAAADSISTLRIIDEVDYKPEVFGLKEPAYAITVNFSGGSEHALEIGDTTPIGNGYYVRVDQEQKIVVVSLDGIDSLLTLLDFPPYLNTPTPTPLPPTETPTPAATNTPELTVTPTP
ncbi:MAG: DUF4340 domain-containing protein [Chloroflexota bacterium]